VRLAAQSSGRWPVSKTALTLQSPHVWGTEIVFALAGVSKAGSACQERVTLPAFWNGYDQ
jgi:hypothetical protein